MWENELSPSVWITTSNDVRSFLRVKGKGDVFGICDLSWVVWYLSLL